MSRNRTSAKAAGRDWENAICEALIHHGWPHAERRRLAGSKDRGDVAGVGGVVIEAKNTASHNLAGAVDEAKAEAANDGHGLGVAWLKRRGRASATEGYVVMAGSTFIQLLKEAGY